jgi:hypothetical protein
MSRRTRGAASAAPLATVTRDSATPALADQWEAEALSAIESVQDPAEAEQLLGKVKLATEAMRVAKLGQDRERRWKALGLKAERRYGELLGPADGSTKRSVSTTNTQRRAEHQARKVAAVADDIFSDYIANDPKPSREGLLRKARPRKPKTANPNSRHARSRIEGDSARGAWSNDEVVAWTIKRLRRGATVNDLIRESDAGAYDWPLPGQGLGQNAAEKCKAIAEDRRRRGDTNRRRQPTESGKRLRQLNDQKRAGRAGDLWHLQKAIAEAVGMLERFDLPELDWSEETETLIVEIYDDLERHARWNDAAIDAVTAHMDDLGRQRKIKMLRDRADDPSSTPFERTTAARLADRLERKQSASRLTS